MTTTPAQESVNDVLAVMRVASPQLNGFADRIAAPLSAPLPVGGGEAVRMLEIVMGSREQCDADGQMIAVSRQALEELAAILATHPQAAPPKGDAVDDDTIARLAFKHLPREVADKLTFERSPPMFPQATYDVPTVELTNFTNALIAAISTQDATQ